ncbi:hypothetical protein AB0B45_46360 [Nonomuraea sp. NPDC049152]|uniref:hypothetical protein n=1 Tax=Nonomuraea sp. NPDC049152 TaxID=3154350 RepID=UPI0033DEF74A
MFDRMDMPNPTHLYDLLETHWENVADGFAAVWVEGLTVEETARRLGADLGSATALTLADIGLGFEGDEMPGHEDGIVLVGPFVGSTSVMEPKAGLECGCGGARSMTTVIACATRGMDRVASLLHHGQRCLARGRSRLARGTTFR